MGIFKREKKFWLVELSLMTPQEKQETKKLQTLCVHEF